MAEEIIKEKKAAEKKPAAKKPAEKKVAEKKPAEKKTAEKKAAEKKPVEKKAAEKKPAEKKPAEAQAAEKKPAESKSEKSAINNPAMQKLAAQMQEYVKMEEELEFSAFSAYYQDVMACLQADYQLLNTEELVTAQGICGIMATNAGARATKKDANRKKFFKMQEKSEFWQKAIKARLLKDGMSEAELTEKTDGLWA